MTDSLVFEDVTFSYRGSGGKKAQILSQLSFTIKAGEFVSVIGPSGSGKSTLFRLISGLETQDEGKIFMNGEAVQNRLGHIGYMSQKDGLLPWLTVLENAALPLTLKRLYGKKAQKDVIEQLERFGLKGFESSYPHELSGGMRQRVSFLRALLSGSELLLLDEPFSALDAVTKMVMQEWLLEQWAAMKKTILFITHDVEEALFLSDRILVFSESPVNHLEEIVVPLARPRTVADLKDPAFTGLKEKLLMDLKKMVSI
ncbi:ABC transporter ATP-binding protein [Siminovitchia terrae]|uniref:ABC transporter ATP-binding protein n=1 Tax=Siminovitchia terrae TaxID=1914933 RepID=A0A429X1B2_SIMTE|nr:ABC transporter ATP-binding protein [Siminovitchia terrae]RST56998.1 ABC transporter ATP-binding protein [Siminovitchia terrae]GIN93046.1 ABC transporter ATP-binding protein [Siminovitchia terrae]